MVDSFTTRAFVEKCQNVLNFSDNRRIDEYYYTSLPFCILDAVFSIGAHYRSTEKVVERYAKFCGMNRYTFENQTDICTVQRFIENFEKEETIGLFAKNVLCNRQRTSPRNGILKAEASYQIAKILHGYCVDTLTDFRNLSEEKLTEVSKQLLAVRGQGSGIMLRYFIMLTGDDDTCKPDRHIRYFLEPITGKDITDLEIQELFEKAISSLRESHPHLTIRRLDNLIWNYQRKI